MASSLLLTIQYMTLPCVRSSAAAWAFRRGGLPNQLTKDLTRLLKERGMVRLLLQLVAVGLSLIVEFHAGLRLGPFLIRCRLVGLRQFDGLGLPFLGLVELTIFCIRRRECADALPILTTVQLISLVRVLDGLLSITVFRVGASCLKPCETSINFGRRGSEPYGLVEVGDGLVVFAFFIPGETAIDVDLGNTGGILR